MKAGVFLQYPQWALICDALNYYLDRSPDAGPESYEVLDSIKHTMDSIETMPGFRKPSVRPDHLKGQWLLGGHGPGETHYCPTCSMIVTMSHWRPVVHLDGNIQCYRCGVRVKHAEEA